MHRVEIAIERTYYKNIELELNDDDYTLLLEGDLSPIEKQGLLNDMENNEPDTDYAVYDIDTEKQVVDWR